MDTTVQGHTANIEPIIGPISDHPIEQAFQRSLLSEGGRAQFNAIKAMIALDTGTRAFREKVDFGLTMRRKIV